MKDWKAETGQRNYYRRIFDSRRLQDESFRDKFKELLVEVLGR